MAKGATLSIVTALLLFGYTAIALADGSPEAEREIARGHALLMEARLEVTVEAREELLSEAVEAFKSGYRWFGSNTQVRCLLGAAQGYLMMEAPRRVFPFLWQATPLQRAERSAQQALVMQPDNPAAAFLLSLVHGRYAQAEEEPSEAAALSREYASTAAALGMPVGAAGEAVNTPQPFLLHDTFVVLMYGDITGAGAPDDLLFIYEKHDQRLGVVVVEGNAYPLTTETSAGSLLGGGTFEGVTVEGQPPDNPRVVVLTRQQGVPTEVSFAWNGNGFDTLP